MKEQKDSKSFIMLTVVTFLLLLSMFFFSEYFNNMNMLVKNKIHENRCNSQIGMSEKDIVKNGINLNGCPVLNVREKLVCNNNICQIVKV